MNLSTTEVAQRLRSSNQFVRVLINNNELPASKVGRTWVIESNDLKKWVKDTNYVVEPHDHPRSSFLVPNKVALSFFTGAGGLDIGMAQAGITPVLVNDIDKNARKSIARNYPELGLVGDMTKLDADKVYEYANLPKNTKID